MEGQGLKLENTTRMVPSYPWYSNRKLMGGKLKQDFTIGVPKAWQDLITHPANTDLTRCDPCSSIYPCAFAFSGRGYFGHIVNLYIWELQLTTRWQQLKVMSYWPECFTQTLLVPSTYEKFYWVGLGGDSWRQVPSSLTDFRMLHGVHTDHPALCFGNVPLFAFSDRTDKKKQRLQLVDYLGRYISMYFNMVFPTIVSQWTEGPHIKKSSLMVVGTS